MPIIFLQYIQTFLERMLLVKFNLYFEKSKTTTDKTHNKQMNNIHYVSEGRWRVSSLWNCKFH